MDMYSNTMDSSVSMETSVQVETDAQLKAYRRKIQRRQANRKSAQLSRARKKAYLDELKHENIKLQRFVDLLESQPEVMFCITLDGRLSYISQRTRSLVYGCQTLETDYASPDLSNILTKDSATRVLQAITEAEYFSQNPQCQQQMFSQQLSSSQVGKDNLSMLCSLTNSAGINASAQPVIDLLSVKYHDSAGYIVDGHLRCSKVITDGVKPGGSSVSGFTSDIGTNLSTMNPMTTITMSTEILQCTDEASSSSSLPLSRKRNRNTTKLLDNIHSDDISEDFEDQNGSISLSGSSTGCLGNPSGKPEYVCVIRPTNNQRKRNPLELFSSALYHVNGKDDNDGAAMNDDQKNKNARVEKDKWTSSEGGSVDSHDDN